MTCQLPADCLNEIFKYLEDDIITLHSCLLVNRLSCEIAVRILWSFRFDIRQKLRTPYQKLAIINTLIACLPNESKDLLHKNRIVVLQTQKPPLFNYASFCKVLSICTFDKMIQYFLENQKSEKLNYGITTE